MRISRIKFQSRFINMPLITSWAEYIKLSFYPRYTIANNIKTKYEGAFYRCSAKRNPRTDEPDCIYAFWYVDAEGKGHCKTVDRQSTQCSPKVARDERAKFLAPFGATGINPIEQGKVTIRQAVDGYVRWGRSEGKYVDQRHSQYRAHLKGKIHRSPIAELNPNILSDLKADLLKTPAGNPKPKKPAKSAAKKVSIKARKLLAPQTVNNIFSFMRSAVNHAIATKLWRGSVWKMAKVNNKRLRFFTHDEARALLADLESRHHQLHDMGLFSLKIGLRGWRNLAKFS